jgi:hypothetical protein
VIHVPEALEPSTFDAKVRQPGLTFLKKRKGKQALKAYWRRALDDLMAAYHEICAYSCFRIHPVTGSLSADHFAAKSLDERKAYEWSNYRLCCSRLNSRKKAFDDVLDPFLIKTGWFQLELVGFQVLPDPTLPKATRQEVQDTIDRLGLNDFRRRRESDAEDYWRRGMPLDILRRESPFVAEELRRQGRLNPGDTWS